MHIQYGSFILTIPVRLFVVLYVFLVTCCFLL